MMLFHPRKTILNRFLDGELSDKKANLISSHLERCPACRNDLEILKKVEQANVPIKNLPENFREQIVNVLPDMQVSSKPFCGETKSVLGGVKVYTGDDPKGIQAFPGMAITAGDGIRVSKNSLALIELLDGSLFYLNKETEFNFAASPDHIHLRMGEFFAMMKPQKEVFKIQTPSALLGVIGTDFDAEVTKDEKTVLRVIKGKVSFQNQAGKVIVKKKKQAEASQHSTPVVSSISNYRDIASWMNPVKRKNGKKGTIMKNLFWLLAILGIVVGAIFLFPKEEKPDEVKEDSPAKADIPQDDNSYLVLNSPFAVQGLSWKFHIVSQVTGSNSGENVEYEIKVEVIQSDKQNGSLVALTMENVKDPALDPGEEKAMIGKQYSYRVSPEGKIHSPGTYDGTPLVGAMEVITFVRVIGYYVMSDLYVNKQVLKDQEWTTSMDFQIPGFQDSFVRGQSRYRFKGYTTHEGKELAVISREGMLNQGGFCLTIAPDPGKRELDVQNVSVESQDEYYLDRKTGRVISMTGTFKEYDRRMTFIQHVAGRAEPIKRPSNPAGVASLRTTITIEY